MARILAIPFRLVLGTQFPMPSPLRPMSGLKDRGGSSGQCAEASLGLAHLCRGDWVCTLCRSLTQPEMEYDCENARYWQPDVRPLPGLSMHDQKVGALRE